ncbi:restriction endonuclease [Streptomyces sp. NPDC090106]|uniref:restriction endonuclease n=1 Tax=Streptomyces sp. NPDC090106 TaxID=3365946 RepID=UPI0038053820
MAAKKGRLRKVMRRLDPRWRVGLSVALALAVLVLLAQTPWLLVTVLCLGALAGAGWVLRKAHLRERTGDLAWREQDRRMELERSMTVIDAMSWQDFEQYVAELCRRDGCTGVSVTGGSGDLGADVVGTLPDGRRLVVQVKHYAADRTVPSGDMQKFVGTAKLEHKADVALFVATCPFGQAARELALRHDITALNRDLFGAWNSGARLQSLLPLNGSGDGPRRRPKSLRKPGAGTP